jgi:hypothetical protein
MDWVKKSFAGAVFPTYIVVTETRVMEFIKSWVFNMNKPELILALA